MKKSWKMLTWPFSIMNWSNVRSLGSLRLRINDPRYKTIKAWEKLVQFGLNCSTLFFGLGFVSLPFLGSI